MTNLHNAVLPQVSELEPALQEKLKKIAPNVDKLYYNKGL